MSCRRVTRASAVALVIIVLVFFVAGNRAETPGVDPSAGYISEVLPNGLRVSILPDVESPLVATQLWLHVGSAHEDPESRGFAHLFEHLMFGETTNHSGDEYELHHHRHGGYENAYTSFDETVYVSVIAADQHATVLEMEADRLVNLVLNEENLENEKRIVAEELRLVMENDPFSRVGVAALKTVLDGHPYAHTPGGTRENVAAATLEQSRSFYDRYYRPGNAHLVIVGPVDGPATRDVVERLFTPLPAGGESAAEIVPLIDWPLPRDPVVLKEDLPPAEIAIVAYPLPPLRSGDRWPLAVMQQLLGGGGVDLFEEELVNRRQKAVFAQTAWLEMRQGGALAFITASVPYRRRSTAFRLVDQSLRAVADGDWLAPEKVEAAKRTLTRREMERVYHVDRRAAAIGRAWWWMGDETLAFDDAQRIAQVSPEQVKAVFERYVLVAEPARVYLRPERVPLHVRLFGWLYPLVD